MIVITMVGSPSEFPVTYHANNEVSGKSVAYDDLATYVVGLASTNKVTDIKIIGNPTYAEDVVDQIQEINKLQYGVNNLEIEVISQ